MAKRKVEIPKGSWLDQKGQRWMKVDIRDFDNLQELERYLHLMKNYPKAQKNVLNGKCAECEKAKFLKCQGGCLGFAMEAK